MTQFTAASHKNNRDEDGGRLPPRTDAPPPFHQRMADAATRAVFLLAPAGPGHQAPVPALRSRTLRRDVIITHRPPRLSRLAASPCDSTPPRRASRLFAPQFPLASLPL